MRMTEKQKEFVEMIYNNLKLESAGYDYHLVQSRVNELENCKGRW